MRIFQLRNYRMSSQGTTGLPSMIHFDFCPPLLLFPFGTGKLSFLAVVGILPDGVISLCCLAAVICGNKIGRKKQEGNKSRKK